MNWKVYHTQEQFNPIGFGDETITKSSFLFNMQVDNKIPNWVKGSINMNEVADESQTVQLGISEDKMFYELKTEPPQTSSWNKYPTKGNPYSRYKFTSFDLRISADKLVVNRQTYSLLDWLGDLGGLFDALC